MSNKFTRPVIDAIDHRNTKDGGCVSPTRITLPPFMVQALIKETDAMTAEARKLEQRRLKDMAKPWKPPVLPPFVDHRKRKSEPNVAILLAIAIFTAWCSAKLLGVL